MNQFVRPRLTGKTLMGSLSCLRRAAHESVVEEEYKPRLAEVVAKEAIVLGLLADPDRREDIVRDIILRTDVIRYTKRPKMKGFSTKQDVALFAIDAARRLGETGLFHNAKPIPKKTITFDDCEVYLPMDLYLPKTSTIYSIEIGSSPSRLRGVGMAMALLKTAKEEITYGGILRVGKDIQTLAFDPEGIGSMASLAFRNLRLAFQHIQKGGKWDEIECRPTERTCAKCPLVKTEECPESTFLKIGDL